METAPASTTSAAAPAAASGGSSEQTASAQAATANGNPPITVSTGAPGTSSANQPAAGTGKWYDSYDADTKEYVTQKGFADPKAVVESYRNLEKLRGVPQDRLLKLPDANAGADAPEWNDIYSKLGKPATPEGYGLKPKDPNQAGFTNWAKDTFHKMNLTATQGQELVKQFDAYNQTRQAEINEAHTQKVTQQTQALKTEWGAAYQQNLSRAQSAYRQFGIPDAAIDSLEQSIGFDGVMKLFHKLGTQVGEHDFIGGNGGQGFGEGTILTPEQANAKIKALKQDTAWAANYIKGGVKERAEMERLMKMANPS